MGRVADPRVGTDFYRIGFIGFIMGYGQNGKSGFSIFGYRSDSL
jgi:hypothetical protein